MAEDDLEDREEFVSPPAVPFDYTNRDYLSIKKSLVDQVRARVPEWEGYNDANDFALALIEAFAFLTDGFHFYLDRIANEAFLRTAVRPSSIRAFANLLNYRPSPASSASTTLKFTNTSSEPIDIPVGTRVQTVMVDDVYMAPVYFETTETVQSVKSAEKLAGGDSVELAAVEGQTIKGDDGNGDVIGISTGASWQVYSLPRAPVLNGEVTVYVSYSDTWDNPWSQVEDIHAANRGMEAYSVDHAPNGLALINFGSRQSGTIPPTNSLIKCRYRIGGGRRGNVLARSLTVLSDDLSLIGLTVTNEKDATGGADEETLESIRLNASWTGTTSLDHAVTLADFEKLAISHVRVGKAIAVAPDPSIVSVYIAPIDDGTLYPGAEEVTENGVNFLKMSNDWSYYIVEDPVTGVKTPMTGEVLATVTKALEEASFAGAEVHVNGPTYRQVWVSAEVTLAVDANEATKAAVMKRLSDWLSYKYVNFGQVIRVYDVTKIFNGMQGVENVVITQLNKVGEPDKSISTVVLAPEEIPWINVTESAFTFLTEDVDSEEETIRIHGQSPSPKGFTTLTDSGKRPIIY